jgi:hypothetical protein
VSRAEREPAVAGTLDTAEAGEDRWTPHGRHAGHSTTGAVGVPLQNTSTTCEIPDGLVPQK